MPEEPNSPHSTTRRLEASQRTLLIRLLLSLLFAGIVIALYLAMSWPLAVLGAIVMLYLWVRGERRTRARKAETARFVRALQIVDEHEDALFLQYQRKAVHDAYGKRDMDAWAREIDYFVRHVVLTEVGILTPDHINQLMRIIVERVVKKDAKEKLFDVAAQDIWRLDSGSYEIYCAELLKRGGWQTELTKASGDQGIDILATKSGRKAVFQCKLTREPAGNSAVQEAIAGRIYAHADVAFVICPSGFTRAARELADTAQVQLVDHRELVRLDSSPVRSRLPE